MSPLSISTIRPGLLVSLKSTCRGNVSYQKQELDRKTQGDASIVRWETTRVIADAQEQERATVVRGRACNLIKGVCSRTSFGLLCPEENKWRLEDAVVQAQELAAEFNRTAVYNRIDLYVITGVIVPNDAEAVRAISAELRDLLNTMDVGIAARDVETIRTAAKQAKNVGQMLSPQAQERIQEAIDSARSIATFLKQRAEEATVEIDQQQLAALRRVRTEFLDLEEAARIGAPIVQSRAIDLEVEHVERDQPEPKPTAAVEIEGV